MRIVLSYSIQVPNCFPLALRLFLQGQVLLLVQPVQQMYSNIPAFAVEKYADLAITVAHFALCDLAYLRRRGARIWRRWKAGESLHKTARALDKNHGSIQFLTPQCGGIAPAGRRPSQRTLTSEGRKPKSIANLRMN